MSRLAVVVFPGSNCEHDVVTALGRAGIEAELVWHEEESLNGADGVVLPGGFAHGDYLRPGAIARFSPVMAAVTELAASGAPVIGICNGFQVLTEAGLLPGALRRNAGRRFICRDVTCVIETTDTPLTAASRRGERIVLPINHNEGNFTCDEKTLSELAENDQIVFRYDENPNGSLGAIAGICNKERNVVGLMPHPERASESLLGSEDGLKVFSSLHTWLVDHEGSRLTAARSSS
jgi:phosphoribosylformylglycinamidine synthase I